jgi:hypothetical protein
MEVKSGIESRETPDRTVQETKPASPVQKSTRSTPSQTREYVCRSPDMS